MDKRHLVKIVKQGDSYMISIPKAFMQHMNVQRGELLYWMPFADGIAQLVKFETGVPREVIKA